MPDIQKMRTQVAKLWQSLIRELHLFEEHIRLNTDNLKAFNSAHPRLHDITHCMTDQQLLRAFERLVYHHRTIELRRKRLEDFGGNRSPIRPLADIMLNYLNRETIGTETHAWRNTCAVLRLETKIQHLEERCDRLEQRHVLTPFREMTNWCSDIKDDVLHDNEFAHWCELLERSRRVEAGLEADPTGELDAIPEKYWDSMVWGVSTTEGHIHDLMQVMAGWGMSRSRQRTIYEFFKPLSGHAAAALDQWPPHVKNSQNSYSAPCSEGGELVQTSILEYFESVDMVKAGWKYTLRSLRALARQAGGSSSVHSAHRDEIDGLLQTCIDEYLKPVEDVEDGVMRYNLAFSLCKRRRDDSRGMVEFEQEDLCGDTPVHESKRKRKML